MLFLSACSIKEYKHLQKVDGSSAQQLETLFGKKRSYIYKSNALLYGEKVSGILAIKQMKDESLRTILTSYLGLKFFDFEFKGEEFKVHKIMDKMDRPILVNVIKSDFQLLLMSNIDLYQLQPFHDPWTGNTVFKYKEGKLTQFYFVNSEDQLERIEQFKKRKKKVQIDINKYRFNASSDVVVKHLDKKIEIRLSLLK
jgi:ribulose 1,5-bisphosphate carboxylase large subunit-like protein